MRRICATAATVLTLAAIGVGPVAGQAGGDAGERQALRAQIEQRFDVLPVQDGVLLTPRRPLRGIRAIELKGGTIAIDGAPVTGSELRDRVGAGADAVLRLSYLDGPEQQALFGVSGGQAVQPPSVTPPTPPAPPLLEPPRVPRPPRSRHGNADRVRIGGGVTVGSDEAVEGDVVAIGGSATIDGRVAGDVVAVGGGADLGPHADIGGDVTVVGGTLHRDPAARVGGAVNEIALGNFQFFGGRRGVPGLVSQIVSQGGRPLVSFVGTAVRLALVFAIVSLVLFLGRGYVERIGARAAAEPLKAGIVGLLIQLLLVPILVLTIVVLVVTIIGIPLLVLVPLALLVLAVFWVVGFTAVVQDLGRFLAARFGWTALSPYALAALGLAAVLAPALLSAVLGFGGVLLVPLTAALVFFGFCFEYVVWTIGLGAVALVRFDPR
jgi:hypothetical protein